MTYQRILTIQDISCIGQCSMTVALPILSACGHEVCILPSAVLSTHTGGFGKPAVKNLTGVMPDMMRHWQDQKITFDAIYTGYLGSLEAIAHTREIADRLLAPGGKLIVDPAMADHGKLYSGFDSSYAEAMTELCLSADVMIPNITEAAMMTGLSYKEDVDESYVRELLSKLGGREVVLTGAGFRPDETGAAIRLDGAVQFYHHKKVGRNYHGTGDIFASAFTGAWMSGKNMEQAVQIAADYTCLCIEGTYREPAHWYGVKFEPVLPALIEMLK